MKTFATTLVAVVVLTTFVSARGQYQSPRQYLRRLPQTQAPSTPAQPPLPPGPTVTPPPNSTPVPTAADAAKASAEKDATVKRTIEFQRKRAESGSASAQYALGLRYVLGDGLEKNLAEGCKWLRAAAKQDYVWAKKKLTELEKEHGQLPPDPPPVTEAGKDGKSLEAAPAPAARSPGDVPDQDSKPATEAAPGRP